MGNGSDAVDNRFFSFVLAAAFLGVAAMLLLLTGCRMVQSTAALPVKAIGKVAPGTDDQHKIDPVELQQQMMRFADQFAAGLVASADQLRRGTNTLDRVELEKWKLTHVGDILAIASGQNALANLLDMLVFTTMARTAVEEYWLPKVYGDSARATLETCRDAELKIWRLADPVLKPGQADELRQAVRNAYAHRGNPEMLSNLRAVGLAEEIGKNNQASRTTQPTSVFGLLQIDPLAGLDPAAREIAETRLFAERALYIAQRMPWVLRWQTELLSYQLFATPEATQVLTNLDRFGDSAGAFTRLAEQLPALLSDQREAAIKQIFQGLAVERTNLIANLAADEMKLRGTLAELRQTLEAGSEMAKSVNGAVRALDGFVGRFDKGTNASPTAATNSRPFDILDYANMARETAAAARELNGTLGTLDQGLPRVQKASLVFENTAQRLLNRLFLMGAALIAFLVSASVAGVLVYNRLTRNASSPRKNPQT